MEKGRPTKYKPEYCESIVQYFSEGFKEHITPIPFLYNWCQSIGITKKTAHNWKEQHEDFLHAYDAAKELQKQWLVQGGLDGSFNAAFCKFVAINMTDMVDASEVKQTVTDKKKIKDKVDLSKLSDKQLDTLEEICKIAETE